MTRTRTRTRVLRRLAVVATPTAPHPRSWRRSTSRPPCRGWRRNPKEKVSPAAQGGVAAVVGGAAGGHGADVGAGERGEPGLAHAVRHCETAEGRGIELPKRNGDAGELVAVDDLRSAACQSRRVAGGWLGRKRWIVITKNLRGRPPISAGKEVSWLLSRWSDSSAVRLPRAAPDTEVRRFPDA